MRDRVTGAELDFIGTEIVVALGTWTVDHEWAKEYRHNIMADGPEGMRICIEPGRKAGRLAIHGTYPYIPGRHAGTRLKRVEITVAASRGPDAIAREIERRVLPEYRKILAGYHAELGEEEEMRRRRDAFAAKILRIAPGATATHDQSASYADFGQGKNARIGYRADSVNLELRWLPPDVALRIIEIAAKAPRA